MLDIANYADDNSPFTVANSIPQVISNLEIDTKNLLSWIKYNGLKANPDKFHLLLSDTDLNLSMQVDNNEIFNSLSKKLLGVKIDNKAAFKIHVEGLCKTASQKLHGLARVGRYMTFEQRRIILHSFLISQFGYCPLVWMFHTRDLNNKINKIHKRALRIVYQDTKSSFEDLLDKEKSFTVHERNIQTIGIELYKVAYGIAPKIMRLIFPTNAYMKYPWENIFQTFNVKTVWWGTETLYHLGPKIWRSLPLTLKKLPSLSKFKKAIRLWKPNCPCRICKVYIHGVGFVNVTS